jgi:hypothetical protein
MPEFLSDEWFTSLQQHAELFDQSDPEEKPIVVLVSLTEGKQFCVESIGPGFSILENHEEPDAEFRMAEKHAREFVLNPRVETIKSQLVAGEIMARGDLTKGFALIEYLETTQRGKSFTEIVHSLTD